MSCEEHAKKKAQAIELRRAGYSRAQIKSALGVRNDKSINRWVKGVPAPEWTKRPTAKDSMRQQAFDMRRKGLSYSEIRRSLKVSKSSLSLWLREIPLTDEQADLLINRQATGSQKGAATMRAARILREKRLREESAAQIGSITARELFFMGVIAYWAEGHKAKPWNPSPSMRSVNSDPDMIKLYLAWLGLLGIERERLVFALSIHESADIAAATSHWAKVVGVDPSTFRRPALKRHNLKTIRKNVGIEYVGCLTITVRRGLELYRRVAGWYEGIIDSMGRGLTARCDVLGVRDPGSNPGAPAECRAADSGSNVLTQLSFPVVGEPRGEYQCRRPA